VVPRGTRRGGVALKSTEYCEYFETRNDLVVIRRDKAYEKFGEIFIPNRYQERQSRGIIVSLGFTARVDGIEIGKRYLFGKHSGSIYIMGGQEFTVLHPQELICEVLKIDETELAQTQAA